MSRPQPYIIYIPGLGDRYDIIRRSCLWTWRLYGANVQLVASEWRGDEALDVKINRIKQTVQTHVNRGRRVVLLGESAGGSLALNTYATMPETIAGVVTLCGKNTRADNVSPRLYRHNPAFRASMQQVDVAARQLTRQQRQRVTSVYPLWDAYVPRVDTLIPDCRQVKLYSVGHLTSILFGLTFGAIVLIREARRLGHLR